MPWLGCLISCSPFGPLFEIIPGACSMLSDILEVVIVINTVHGMNYVGQRRGSWRSFAMTTVCCTG